MNFTTLLAVSDMNRNILSSVKAKSPGHVRIVDRLPPLSGSTAALSFVISLTNTYQFE
jgi:hypothetical protein